MSTYRVSVAKRELEIEGDLKKWTNSFTRWKTRSFRLSGGMLTYARPTNPTLIKGTIPLDITTVTYNSSHKREFIINTGLKKLKLKAKSEEEACRWVEALRLAAQLLKVAETVDTNTEKASTEDPLVFSTNLVKRLADEFAMCIREIADFDDGESAVEQVLAASLEYQKGLEDALQLVNEQMHKTSMEFRNLPKIPGEHMTVIERQDQEIEEEVFYDAQDEQQLYVAHASYRTALPARRDPNLKFNIWKVIKDSIGGDLSRIAVPVIFNEPLSFLQRFTEDVAYSDLLQKAADSSDSCLRLAYVACFALSTYSFTLDRTLKPFNPLLCETFELEVGGLRVLAEQVSHHPPVSAIHCLHEAFEFWGSQELKTKFRATYLLVQPFGELHVSLKRWKDHFVWRKPETSVHNIIIGKVYLDHHGSIEIRNTTTGDTALIHLRKRGWFGKNPHMVDGTVLDSTNTPRYLISGTWSQSLIIRNDQTGEEFTGWEPAPLPPNSHLYYHFPEWSLQLNVPPSTYGQVLPPTDSRRRPDQRALEEGNVDLANTEKRRLEEKQRGTRRRTEEAGMEHSPLWFQSSGEEWRYSGGYWEAKALGAFPGSPDIF